MIPMTTSEKSNERFGETISPSAEEECPACTGSVMKNSVETVCVECGLVIEEHPIDRGPEWRSFDSQESSRERTGAPLTPARHDRGLSTEIGYRTDARGNTLSARKRQRLNRLRREHSRGQWRSKKERNLGIGMGEIRRITSAVSLPRSIRDRACLLFRRAHTAEKLRGRSIEAFAAASVYAACRCAGLPRMLEEFVDVTPCDRGEVKNAYSVLNREIELPAQPVKSREFVPRFAAELDLSGTVRQRALTLVKKAEAAGLVGGATPTGFAGACLYKAACDHGSDVRQQDVALVANVSAATIRTHRETVRELCEEFE